MYTLKDKKVLITGGASGIGKLMGEIVLKRGAQLIIWDINPEGVRATTNELSRLGKVTGFVIDVSNASQIKETAALVKKNCGVIDVLINNAGIVVGKYFHEHTSEDINRTMDINANAPMQITLEFLTDMINQNSGHICNIASSAGLISNPKMSVYAASKWSVIGWSDSLRLEMKQLNKNIGVTTVTPYYINTGMFDGIKSVVPILNPDKVARKIIAAIEHQRIFLSMPWSVGFVRFFQGVLPIWFFDWFVGKVMGVYSTMDHFKGRQ
jgi:all-trans-retinol dehydrogenase (NAD+)